MSKSATKSTPKKAVKIITVSQYTGIQKMNEVFEKIILENLKKAEKVS